MGQLVHLLCIADPAICTRSNDGADKVQTTDAPGTVKWILRWNFDGETVWMSHFGWNHSSFRSATIDIRLVSWIKKKKYTTFNSNLSSIHKEKEFSYEKLTGTEDGNVTHVVIHKLAPLHDHVRHV